MSILLQKSLKNKLKGAKKVALLGVGSELRGDDGCGLWVAEHLEKGVGRKTKQCKLKAFIGATAPENLTGEIKKYQPSHLIIVDAADFGKKPGTAQLIQVEKADSFSFCTHNLPIKILTDYLTKSINCEILIIGIQPKTLDFDSAPSKPVAQAAKQIAAMILKSLPS
jgi:hydrogenase 3 maturation protease